MSREALAQAWAFGAGPGDEPLTIDLDFTICETYGLSKEGARHHGYTGQRGYHPLLAVAARTGEVRAGPGKISSVVHWRDCAPCRSLPDRRPRTLTCPL